MAADEKWYFTKEQLANTPSRKCGIDADKELSYRQQAANFIQDMGQRLVVSQLCINTAIVYMHRFYVFHSLSQFHRNSIAAAALFLAAKVEEQPRKLEHVIKVAHMCLHRDTPALDTKSEQYLEQAQDLVFNENVLLQTLGFDVAIDHPHTHVVRCCHLVKASKDLAQTSYFMASNSLHLTTMCLQYKPTVVACFCIHLACKWSNWEIPQSNEGKYWFWYVDKTVTSELLGQLTGEFLHIFDKCPSRLKRKIRSISANQSPNMTHPTLSNSPFDAEPRKVQSPANTDGSLSFQSNRSHPDKSEIDSSKRSSSSMSNRTSVDYREYREKKERERERLERERLEREKAASSSNSSSSVSLNADPSKHNSHHHKQSSSSANIPNKHSSSSSSSSAVKQNLHHNHHHSSRQDVKTSAPMMPQRHSTSSSSSSSSQPRDPNRDRQRMSREYNSSSNTSGGTVFSHHNLDNSLETVFNISQDSSTVHPPEKLSNNVHKPHDGRGNDMRHNSKLQQSQQQKDTKSYSKYPESTSATSRTSSSSSSKKPDILLDQRNDDVRKLIEKPQGIPKPRAEVQKEEYAAMMLKQSHHLSKYGHQTERSMQNTSTTQSAALPVAESKMLNVGQTAFSVEKSPNAPVSASQISQKSLSVPKSSSSSALPVKNGSSSSASASLGLISNLDDAKAEKRPRGYLAAPVGDSENSALQTPPPPPMKHRSLFSPEKTPTGTPPPATSRESSHSRTLKQKQKNSPVVPKHDTPTFASPRLSSSMNMMPTSSQKQHRIQINADIVSQDQESKQQQQQQMLDAHSRRFISGFDMHESLSGFSDLVQPIKNNKNIVDIKPPPNLVKPFENTEQMMMSNQRHKQQSHHGVSNGLDGTSVKQEYSTIDPSSFCLIKPELPDELLSTEMSPDFMFMKQESKVNDFLSYQDKMPEIKRESFSPLKSAQSINALLQEPLALMPSLLHEPEKHEHPHEEDKSSLQQQMLPELPLPSTVDMSDLTGPVQCTIDIPVTTGSAPIVPIESAPVVSTVPVAQEDKKDEHKIKSEKKKKEKKRKHKDKDKSKDKNKHKHKDKDKEKEKHNREKNTKERVKTEEGNGSATSGNVSLGAVPIKITIPKDKLNLSSDSIGTSSSTSSNSSLKIKIPKERLKVNEVPHNQQQQQQLQQQQQQQPPTQSQNMQTQQAPLKIKIRTDALARNTSDLQDNNCKKRERDITEPPIGAPPSKKQQMQILARPNERQNGRHSSYSSGNTDKVRGSGRGAGPRLPQYPYQRYSLQQMRESSYRSYQQQRQSPPASAFLRHSRPHPHPFFANYPPAVQAPPVFGYSTPGLFDPAMYYQYQRQQQEYAAAMYSQSTTGMMMTTDGQIDTSIPPPSLPPGSRHQQQRLGTSSDNFASDPTVVLQPPPPPLPSGPPPSSSPPPPPPPE